MVRIFIVINYKEFFHLPNSPENSWRRYFWAYAPVLWLIICSKWLIFFRTYCISLFIIPNFQKRKNWNFFPDCNPCYGCQCFADACPLFYRCFCSIFYCLWELQDRQYFIQENKLLNYQALSFSLSVIVLYIPFKKPINWTGIRMDI